MKIPCTRCVVGAVGELGHGDLEAYIPGPYPGQNIFKCAICDERWIRHAGDIERYGWTRYSALFPPQPQRSRRQVAQSGPFA